MSEPQNPDLPQKQNLPSASSSSSSSTPNKIHSETNHANESFSSQKVHYPNPPDLINPDPAMLWEQWRFAIRQYSRWYCHALGTAILAGVSFFALGSIIKGSNPFPSLRHGDSPSSFGSTSSDEAKR